MKKRILIIEDNDNNRILEKDLLGVAGFEVLEAENAGDGIVIARKEKLDVILMDVRLPDMKGTELAKILRQDKVTRDIPVIFVTASVIGEAVEEIKKIDNSGYITKPINTRTFTSEIIRYIK